MKKLFGEFKKFVSRGNVLDMAVGVIIGGAVGKIVTSLVNDVIMPIIGIFGGGKPFASLALRIGESNILIGNFIQNIVDFLIIAFVVFLFVKVVNIMQKPKVEEPKPAAKSDEVVLLEAILDELKNK